MSLESKVFVDRLCSFRKEMIQNKIDAYIIPSADPHLSEYLPVYWQGRKWLSGFTGSVGTLVITQNNAGLWVDSRYWEQATKQLEGTGIQLQKLTMNSGTHIDWLAQNLTEQQKVGIDGNVLSISDYKIMKEKFLEKNIEFSINLDLLDHIWFDRPHLPDHSCFIHEEVFRSRSTSEKITLIKRKMKEEGATVHFISSLDDIAWITNLRSNQVSYNPVFLSFLLITSDEVVLFGGQYLEDEYIKNYLLEQGIKVYPFSFFTEKLSLLPKESRLLLDEQKVSIGTVSLVDQDVKIINRVNPSTYLKSIKLPSEIEHIQEAMREDGVALCEFFTWFEQKIENQEKINELDVAEELFQARSRRKHFVSLSFGSIVGFNKNGALPHYQATENNFSVIEGSGLLLIDSGAQYLNGTTDITRVVAVGTLSDQQKKDYTLVLKSHIALSTLVYPENIPAPLIDAVARAPLWLNEIDYGHGTGHGVGYFLNVHEGPQVISYLKPVLPETSLKQGMITSIEPGIYRTGQWGCRIENLVSSEYVIRSDGSISDDYLYFNILTLCPIDTRPILKALLTEKEIAWLNIYHKRVFLELSPRVSGNVLSWLEKMTQPL